MDVIIEIVRCRAVVDERERQWIMSSTDDNERSAREIFQDEASFQLFAVLDRVSVKTSDADVSVFTYVTAEMVMPACLRQAVEIGGVDLSPLSETLEG